MFLKKPLIIEGKNWSEYALVTSQKKSLNDVFCCYYLAAHIVNMIIIFQGLIFGAIYFLSQIYGNINRLAGYKIH